jgi:MFS family permease
VPWPSRTYAWYVLAVLVLAYAFAIIDRVAIGLLVQPIEADLGISDSQMGLLQGFGFGIFYSVMGIPIGFLVDRWQRRRIIAVGIALWSLATVACGLARGFGALFAARVSVGVGEATISPGASSMIGDYFPPEARPRAFGLFLIGTTLGSGLAFLLTGAAADGARLLRAAAPAVFGGFPDWKIVFFMIGAPGLLVAVLLMVSVREPARRERLQASSGFSFRPFWSLLVRNRMAYFALIIGPVLNLAAIYAQLAWFPTLFIRLHGWTIAEIGTALGVVGLVMGTLSGVTSGWFMSSLARAGRPDSPLLVALCHALLLAVFGTAACLVQSPWLSLAFYVAMGLGSNWTYSAALTGINQITPNEMRGQMVALYTLMVGLVSVGAGVSAVGFLSDRVFGGGQGVAPGLATIYAVCGLAATAILLAGRAPFRAAQARALAWSEPAALGAIAPVPGRRVPG